MRPDDFNYPTLNRKDLMSLSTINDNDFPIRKINKINTNRSWSLNLYNLDIERAAPRRYAVFTNKVDFINKVDDIDKARPKKEVFYNYPDFIYNCRDIEKAYPAKVKRSSKRHTNPLEPKYILPKAPYMPPPEPPKFIRDQINISDIEGTKSKPLFPGKMRINNSMYNDDIEKSHPKPTYVRKKFYDGYSPNDINGKASLTLRNPITNPIDPDYGIYGGFVSGSKPKGLMVKDTKTYMSCDDIYGAQPGTKNHYGKFLGIDRSMMYSTSDIKGAQADTRMRGMVSQRCTNPLDPKYQYLGHSENLDEYTKINRENKRYEISKEQERVPYVEPKEGGKKKFKISKSTNDIFAPSSILNQKIENNSNNHLPHQPPEGNEEKKKDSFNWDALPVFEEQEPQFNKEYYRKQSPNFGHVYQRDLFFGHKNRDARLDVQREKKYYLPKAFESTVEPRRVLGKSMSTNELLNRKGLSEYDPLFYKLQPPPSYEQELENYIKDNDYVPVNAK